MRRLALLGALVLAGCGSAHPKATITPSTTPKKVKPVVVSRVDVRFAHLLLGYGRADASAATLCARKAATPGLHAACRRRASAQAKEDAALVAFLRHAKQTTASAHVPALPQSLIEDAGFPFDSDYVAAMIARDASEAAVARREVANGASSAAKALARAAVRARAADAAALRRL